MKAPIIRLIEKKDNPQIAKVIRSVLEDFNVPKVGTAYADAALAICRLSFYIVDKAL